MECLTCLANSGERRISPGPTIYAGEYWLVEHAYPTQLKGWLVIVLKRHVEALHALTSEEFAELGTLLERTTQALYTHLEYEKEYVMCLAEAEHFHHIHVHVAPKPHDLPETLKGAQIFALLGDKVADDAVPPAEIKAFCEALRLDFG